MKTEYVIEIPEVFLKRGGVDNRKPRSQTTINLLQFLDSDAPYCIFTFDSAKEAGYSWQTIRNFINKHHLGIKAIRRAEKILIVRLTAEGGTI